MDLTTNKGSEIDARAGRLSAKKIQLDLLNSSSVQKQVKMDQCDLGFVDEYNIVNKETTLALLNQIGGLSCLNDPENERISGTEG